MERRDGARFAVLYRQYHPQVLAYALRRVSPDNAREAVAETFLIAWRRLPDVPDTVLPWLLVTARNVLRDQHRRGIRQQAMAEAVAALRRDAAQPDPEASVLERLTVLEALSQLSERDREVLILTVWDGLSHRDAAVVAGCSIGSFAVRLHRARGRLAAALDRIDHDRDHHVGAEAVVVPATSPAHRRVQLGEDVT